MTSTQAAAENSTGTFGSRVRALLNERHYGKPITMVAEETGLGYATLQKALNDETQPRYATVVALSEYLGCSVSYLVDGKERSNGAPGGGRAVQFVALVKRRPGIKAAEIGRELGMNTGYVYHVAARLVEEGYVRKDKKNRYFLPKGEEMEQKAAAETLAEVSKPETDGVVVDMTPKPVESATGMAASGTGYREGYRDGYADAVKMLAGRPMTVEQLVA